MFSLENYPTIQHHLRTISTIYKPTSGGSWIQIFCPYCDDSTRKANPTHGHCYIASQFPYFICFRCNVNGSLLKLLLDTNFTDANTIEEIKRFVHTNFKYHRSKRVSLTHKDTQQIITDFLNFRSSNPTYFDLFLDYIYKRCLHINPIDFNLKPTLLENRYLAVSFQNYYNQPCGFRYINHPRKRYTYQQRNYYYFQDLSKIIYYPNIVLCEGTFDLINLYSYSVNFNKIKSFFIAIGGSSFESCVRYLVSNFLLIGPYCFNIVFDNDFKFKKYTIHRLYKIISELNSEIQFKFYEPIAGKDVSDCQLLNETSI